MRWLYFLKILLRLNKFRHAVACPFQSLLQILLRRDLHSLHITGDQFIERHITPPNLYGFMLLREGGIALAPVQPQESDSLLWELLPGRTFRTRLTQGMDLMTLYELFVRKDYGEDFRDKIVVDVGAYNGDSATFFALKGARRVIALEPYQSNYLLACENVERMGLSDRVELLPIGLGAMEGRLPFRVAPTSLDANTFPEGGSALQRFIRYEVTTEVEVWTLPTLLARTDLEEVDFLKLDCEGCEFGVIGSLSEVELRRVCCWHIEYHARPEPLIRKLQSAGFRVRKEKDRGILGYLVAERI